MKILSLFGFLTLILLPLRTEAHPLDLGFIQMHSQGKAIEVTLDVNPSIAAELLGVDVMKLTQPIVESRYSELLSKTLDSAPLTIGNKPCTWGSTTAHLLVQTVRLSTSATCGDGRELHWSFPFTRAKGIPRTFQVLLKADIAGVEHVYTADAEHDAVSFALQTQEQSFLSFVHMGIAHIGATPSEWYDSNGFHLPDGIDHILFLLGLILAGGSVLQMVKTATGFTVGHSVTLAVASLGLIRFPSRFVESMIALSIAYVALETLMMKEPRDRWRIAALFGLVHGFGFASALSNLQLTGVGMAKALVGFNLGVEIGQVILVALMAPVVTFLRKQPVLNRFAVPGCAGGIFFAGAYWFFQRAFGF